MSRLFLPTFILYLILPGCSFSQTVKKEENPVIHWHSFGEALELCKTQPRLIFVDVYAPWCGYCKQMDKRTFSNKEIALYMNAHFYCVKFNAEGMDTIRINGQTLVNTAPVNGNAKTHPFAFSLLDGRLGYPSLVFLDATGKRLQYLQSFLKPSDFEPYLRFMGEGAYKTTSFDAYFKQRNEGK